jgi:hypothetical protein
LPKPGFLPGLPHPDREFKERKMDSQFWLGVIVTVVVGYVISLTKHGAHKVADLLEKVQPNEVIPNA